MVTVDGVEQVLDKKMAQCLEWADLAVLLGMVAAMMGKAGYQVFVVRKTGVMAERKEQFVCWDCTRMAAEMDLSEGMFAVMDLHVEMVVGKN